MAGANTVFSPVVTPLFAGFSIAVAGKIVVTSAQEILESLNIKSQTDRKESQSLTEMTVKPEDLYKTIEALKQSSENLVKVAEALKQSSEAQSGSSKFWRGREKEIL